MNDYFKSLTTIIHEGRMSTVVADKLADDLANEEMSVSVNEESD